MNRRLDRTLTRWLRHERAGDDPEAEKALGELLRSLPSASVPAGFADRVLRASGVPLAGSRPWFAARPWIWQGAFGVWLVSSFVAAIGAIGFASALSRAGLIVGLGSRAMIALTRLGAEIGTAMKALLRAGEAVAAAFSGPETLVLVLGCALASLMALGALSSLLAAERSTRHVESW
ncbi:MAG: hypothetical protein O7A98_07315 [Acidobacteria bacterium]|nr:hypothetical protein [Acidobacteriota bacterium]MCZ6727151.1 hypothetical protein [Acidobacteriota bacterium]